MVYLKNINYLIYKNNDDTDSGANNGECLETYLGSAPCVVDNPDCEEDCDCYEECDFEDVTATKVKTFNSPASGQETTLTVEATVSCGDEDDYVCFNKNCETSCATYFNDDGTIETIFCESVCASCCGCGETCLESACEEIYYVQSIDCNLAEANKATREAQEALEELVADGELDDAIEISIETDTTGEDAVSKIVIEGVDDTSGINKDTLDAVIEAAGDNVNVQTQVGSVENVDINTGTNSYVVPSEVNGVANTLDNTEIESLISNVTTLSTQTDDTTGDTTVSDMSVTFTTDDNELNYSKTTNTDGSSTTTLKATEALVSNDDLESTDAATKTAAIATASTSLTNLIATNENLNQNKATVLEVDIGDVPLKYNTSTNVVEAPKTTANNVKDVVTVVADGVNVTGDDKVTVKFEDNNDNKNGASFDIKGTDGTTRADKITEIVITEAATITDFSTPVLATESATFAFTDKAHLKVSSIYKNNDKTTLLGYLKLERLNTDSSVKATVYVGKESGSFTVYDSSNDITDNEYYMDRGDIFVYNSTDKENFDDLDMIFGLGSVYSVVNNNKIINVVAGDRLAGVSTSFKINVKVPFFDPTDIGKLELSLRDDNNIVVPNFINTMTYDGTTSGEEHVLVNMKALDEGDYTMNIAFNTTQMYFQESPISFSVIKSATSLTLPSDVSTLTVNKGNNSFNELSSSNFEVKFVDADLVALGEELTPSIQVVSSGPEHPFVFEIANYSDSSTGFITWLLSLDESKTIEPGTYEITFSVANKAGQTFTFNNDSQKVTVSVVNNPPSIVLPSAVTTLDRVLTVSSNNGDKFNEISSNSFVVQFNDLDFTSTISENLQLNLLVNGAIETTSPNFSSSLLETNNTDGYVKFNIQLIKEQNTIGDSYLLEFVVVDSNSNTITFGDDNKVTVNVVQPLPGDLEFSLTNNVSMKEKESKTITVTPLTGSSASFVNSLTWRVGGYLLANLPAKLDGLSVVASEDGDELNLTLTADYMTATDNNNKDVSITVSATNSTGESVEELLTVTVEDYKPKFTFIGDAIQNWDSFNLSVQLDENSVDNTKPTISSFNVDSYDELNIEFTMTENSASDYSIVVNYTNSDDLNMIALVPLAVTLTDNSGAIYSETFNVWMVPDIVLQPMVEKKTKTQQIVYNDVTGTGLTVDLPVKTGDYLNTYSSINMQNISINLSTAPDDLVERGPSLIGNDSKAFKEFKVEIATSFAGTQVISDLDIIVYNDQDLDGIHDLLDFDNDNDGISDSQENEFYDNGYDRNDPNKPIEFDVDEVREKVFKEITFFGTQFGKTRFVSCNFKGALFKECTFVGAQNKFLNCNMNNVRFENIVGSDGSIMKSLTTFRQHLRVSEEVFKINFNIEVETGETKYVFTITLKDTGLPRLVKNNVSVLNAKEIYSVVFFKIYNADELTFPDLPTNNDYYNKLLTEHQLLIKTDNTYTLKINTVGEGAELSTFNGEVANVPDSGSLLLRSQFEFFENTNLPTNFTHVRILSEPTGLEISSDDFLYIIGDFTQEIKGIGAVKFKTSTLPKTITVNEGTASQFGPVPIGDLGDTVTVNIPNTGKALTFVNGSTIMTATPKLIPQTIELNTYRALTLSLTESKIRSLTNLSALTEIKKIEISPANRDIYDDSGNLINSVIVEEIGGRFNLSVASNNNVEFPITISVELEDILDENGNNSVFSGDITISAVFRRGMGVTLGDPHITTVSGSTYELPYKVANYRLVQGKDLTINVSTRRLTVQEGKAIKEYYRKVTKRTPPKSLITNGVFYERVIIFYKSSVINFSFSKDNIQKIGNQIKLLNKHTIRINDAELGEMTLKFNYLDNPQEKYGLEFSCSRPEKLSGLLLKEYLAESMMIDGLLDKKYKNGVLGKNKVLSSFIKIRKN